MFQFFFQNLPLFWQKWCSDAFFRCTSRILSPGLRVRSSRNPRSFRSSGCWRVFSRAGVVNWWAVCHFWSIKSMQKHAKTTCCARIWGKMSSFFWVGVSSTNNQHSWRYEDFTFWGDVPANHVRVSCLPTFQDQPLQFPMEFAGLRSQRFKKSWW